MRFWEFLRTYCAGRVSKVPETRPMRPTCHGRSALAAQDTANEAGFWEELMVSEARHSSILPKSALGKSEGIRPAT